MVKQTYKFAGKKLLYIDPLSSLGHLNFNKNYINSLNECFDTIHVAFREGYADGLPIKEDARVFSIPDKFYVLSRNKIFNRFKFLKTLLFLKRILPLDDYDFIILSSYEEVSLLLSFIRHRLILVNHNNLRNLDNPLKLQIFKLISRNNINIVFEQYMKDYLDNLKIDNTIVLKHGLPEPYNLSILNIPQLKEEFSYLERFSHIIFQPSATSVDKIFINNLISDSIFQKFLNDHRIILILKGNYEIQCDNILVIKEYLSDIQYQYLFLKSSMILVSYRSSFQFRVSSILFECLANNKYCLLSNIKSLNIYSDCFNYDPFYNDHVGLVEKIQHYIDNHTSFKNLFSINRGRLQPDFYNFFNKISKGYI